MGQSSDTSAPPSPGSSYDFVSLAAVAALVATLLLYRTGRVGWELLGPGVFSIAAYLWALHRHDWRLMSGLAGVTLGAVVGWLLHFPTGHAWTMSWTALAVVAVVWAPWPTLTAGPARAVLWTLAVAPIGMLVLSGPTVGDTQWLRSFTSAGRLGGTIGINELGIVAAVAVVATLALRSRDDTHVAFALQAIVLALAGDTGTRTALPAIVTAGALWWRGRRGQPTWRGNVIEALPWALYVSFAASPLFLRTAGRFGDGVDRVTSGRWTIWQEYADVAATAPLSGRGLGYSDVLSSGVLTTERLPHNVPLELVVELGLPGALVAFAGLAVVVAARAKRIRGAHRWLLRVPLLVLLPTIALLDLPLKKPELTLPIMVFSAAAAGLTTAGHRPVALARTAPVSRAGTAPGWSRRG